MKHDIQAGDECKIIHGFAGAKSPNVGKIVKVGHTVLGEHGEPHTRFGRVVRVTGPEVYQMDDSGNFVNKGWADIPVIWLEKLPPEKSPDKEQSVDKEITA
jgi:hypothetical protein